MSPFCPRLSFLLSVLMVLLFFGCESEPVQIDLGDSGHQLTVYSTDSTKFKSIQLPNRIGTSSRLYVGNLNGNISSALLKLNSDVFSQHETLCSDDIDSLSLSITLMYQSIISSAPDEITEYQTNPDESSFYIEPPQDTLNAYLVYQSNFDIEWNESSIIDYDTTNSTIYFDGNPINIDPSNAIELPISFDPSGVKLLLDSTSAGYPDSSGIINNLCLDDDNESLWIYLETTSDLLYVFGSANNSYASRLPFLSTEYLKKEVEYFDEIKYEIDSITVSDSVDLYLSFQDDNENNDFGMIIGLPFFPTSSEPIDTTNPESYTSLINWIDTAKVIDFATVYIQPAFHEKDTSHIIEFSLDNQIFVFRNYDPSGDNYSEDDTTGTEGNEYYDYGELFEDCGPDHLCNVDESGYNPNGTEKNGQYDSGEFFLDCGTDSLCNNNSFLFSEECDSIGYAWIEGDGCDVQIEGVDDESGDDYIIDPMGDDWRDCGTDGLCPLDDGYVEADSTEGNGIWDFGEGKENNNQWDEGEPFLDYGVNAIPDSLEGPNYEIDNFNPEDSTGTEGNGIWDQGEWFIDAGLDTVWSSEEEGFNDGGTEGNGIYDFGEIYFDFGIDRVPDSLELGFDLITNPDPDDDNLNLDPMGDDWRDCGMDGVCSEDENYEEADEGESNGSYDEGERWEGNGILNFVDLDNDSLLGITDSSEIWYDWGIDQLEDTTEVYFGSYPLLVELGANNYVWNDTTILDSTFAQPELEGADDVALWISKIHNNLQDNQVEVTLSMFSLSEVSAFQFQLDYIPFYHEDTIWTDKSENIYYVNSLRLIEDVSIYNQTDLDTALIEVNFGNSINALLDFPELEMFVAENPDVIISDAMITVFPDTDTLLQQNDESFRLYLSRLTEPYYEDDDSLNTEYILDYPYYRIYSTIPDSIQLSVKRYVQKLVSNEYGYNKLIFSTDGAGNNFDSFYYMNNSTVVTRLEILYSR